MNNAITWVEIPVADFGRARNVYESVFKVKIELIQTPRGKWGMFPFRTDETGGGVAIVEGKGYEPSKKSSLVYFTGGDNLSKPLSRVEKAGGKIILPKTSNDGFGFIAVFTDTEGNKIGQAKPIPDTLVTNPIIRSPQTKKVKKQFEFKKVKMKQQDYNITITAAISAEEAFEKISNVADWWTKSFKGKAKEAGDTFTIQFGETRVAFEIVEAARPKKIVWRVTNSYLHWLNNKDEWQGTKIVWEVSSKNKRTQITMTHVGLTPGIECYYNCVKGWDEYINESLLKLLTVDKGAPHTISKL